MPNAPLPSTLVTRPIALPPLTRFPDHTRAFVKVQDGCDARCSFCIVPRLRPALDARPLGEVVEEIRGLVDAGYREVVLTGIFLGAYGRPTAIRRRWVGPSPLLELLDAVTRIEGLARVRLSSLEPGDVTDELVGLMAERRCLVPHLHLPLQSGSDAVLRRMNRQYARDDYERMIQRVRGRLDRPAITTDLIVGFPGETDADFQATLDAARRAGFADVHVFRFSPRPGTPAARRTARLVPAAVARERAARLEALAAELSLDYRRQFIGQDVGVIVERPDPRRPGIRRGRADRFFMVHFPIVDFGFRISDCGSVNPQPGQARQPEPVDLTGRLATVRVEQVTASRTIGALISIDDGPSPRTMCLT